MSRLLTLFILMTFAFGQTLTQAAPLSCADEVAPWPELPGLTRAPELDTEKQGSTGGRWYREADG
ncbi:MAG: hypothetical protein AAF202_13180, partial [Pseudomonadota bacterium]